MGGPWVPHTVHGIFDRTVKKSEKFKNRSRKIGAFKKNEKQKCDLQFAPTELNELLIEIPCIFIDFYIRPLGPFGGPGGAQGPPQAPKI